ncbi:MAG: hypothetical protein IT304_11755 [Dehalococcoidia bacterium]|nr:hypothetical protein [Dehalococcoidia bacterium]
MRGFVRRFWVPAVAVALVVGVAIALIVLAYSTGEDGRPAVAPPFPPPPASAVPYDVRARDGGRLVLAAPGAGGATLEASLAPGARVEFLRPAVPADLAPGDLLVVTGVPDDTKNFAIRSVIALAGGTEGDDGLPRSPAGFSGDEVARTPGERPILGGRVHQIDPDAVTIDGPQGLVRVGLAAGAPLFRLAPASVDDIRQGDRLALRGELAAVAAVLVVTP